MDHIALLERGPQRTVQSVLEVEVTAPAHHMGEEVTVERGVVIEEGIEMEGGLRGDQIVEPDLRRRHLGPTARVKVVGRVGPLGPDTLEDHSGDYIEVTGVVRINETAAMPTSNQWLTFVVASILFIQVPGPSLLFTIGRALTVGRRDALLSVLGNALGLLVQVFAVAVGLGAVIAASATAYTVLKICGALYVVWLGVSAIRHRADARAALEVSQELPEGRGRALGTGVLVGLTNPKTIVFFVAFLPQFTNHAAGRTGLQIALLGLVFAVMAVASDSCWALAASRARDWFAREPHRLDRLGAAGGVMMIGLGATLVVSD